MTPSQAWLAGILLLTTVAFFRGRWRHDMVAAGALLACVVVGLVPAAEAFAGFGHPAVITVACALVLSRGLQDTGVVDVLVRRVLPAEAGPTRSIVALTALAAGLSGFINNVAALAMLMPVALQLADRQQLAPARVLMPLAFASILGGMTTLIGTPPNLIVSAFRAENGLASFGMFAFTPVGVAVAGLGVIFVALIGWRLVPARARATIDSFDTGHYLTEARVPDEGGVVGKRLGEIESTLDEIDAQVVGLVRNDLRMNAPATSVVLHPGDILVIEAEPESLAALLSRLGLRLEEAVAGDIDGDDETGDAAGEDEHRMAETESQPARRIREADDAVLLELVVQPDSRLIGRSASDVRLRTQYGINLLAVSSQGRQSIRRLRSTRLHAGQVLLMQGPQEALSVFAAEFGCVPLASRAIRIPRPGRAALAVGVLAAAVAIAALGLLPTAVSFAAGVLVFMATGIVPPRKVYEDIDWSVIVLLAALIPVAGAMAATGTADLAARVLLDGVGVGRPVVALAAILVVTMTVSDFMNNAATAAVMCPIALSTASQLGVSGDTFLMAVAVGASCAFLTPIGHQNSTLILGPGGLRFGDYWRLGLPLEILVVAVALPMLLLVWPL
jgi:di/tricarboxylate transporter